MQIGLGFGPIVTSPASSSGDKEAYSARVHCQVEANKVAGVTTAHPNWDQRLERRQTSELPNPTELHDEIGAAKEIADGILSRP